MKLCKKQCGTKHDLVEDKKKEKVVGCCGQRDYSWTMWGLDSPLGKDSDLNQWGVSLRLLLVGKFLNQDGFLVNRE